MASLKEVLQKSSSYLSTAARLFGVDPWPLEHMPDKKPESLPELLQAVQSLLAYFLRQLAEVEDHLNQVITESAEVKSAQVQYYALGLKNNPSFDKELEYQCAVDAVDSQVKIMKKHSAMHMEDITSIKDLQTKVVKLFVLNAKVDGGLATLEESSEHDSLSKQTKEMYYSFVADALKRQDEMEDDESGDEEELADGLSDNDEVGEEEEFADGLSDNDEVNEEGLDQTMEKLKC